MTSCKSCGGNKITAKVLVREFLENGRNLVKRKCTRYTCKCGHQEEVYES